MTLLRIQCPKCGRVVVEQPSHVRCYFDPKFKCRFCGHAGILQYNNLPTSKPRKAKNMTDETQEPIAAEPAAVAETPAPSPKFKPKKKAAVKAAKVEKPVEKKTPAKTAKAPTPKKVAAKAPAKAAKKAAVKTPAPKKAEAKPASRVRLNPENTTVLLKRMPKEYEANAQPIALCQIINDMGRNVNLGKLMEKMSKHKGFAGHANPPAIFTRYRQQLTDGGFITVK